MSEPQVLPQIRKQLLKHSIQPQYYPFLTRFELLAEGDSEKLQAYSLHSLARTDFSLLEVFDLFFPLPKSPVKTEVTKKVNFVMS
jgi:hypothetical protein